MEMISDTRTKRCLGTPSEPGQQQAARVSCMDMMAEHQSHLLQQLDEQRRQELFCDCHVLVEGQLFKAHRNVLFSSSGYFRMLLAHSVAEFGQPVSASFEAFSADTFSIILDFIYSGRLNLTSTNVIEVMSAASYLQMNDVIGFCKGFIRSSLDISAKDADDQCLNLPEESIIPPVSSHVPIPQVMFCEDSKPEVSTLRRSPGTPPSRGRRRGSAAHSVKVEHLTESTGYRGRGRRRAWSALSRAESASITDLQGAASSKAQKADDLYASLPTIVGVVGVFNKDSSPTMRFKCPFCTHTVKRKADLKRHLRCHTGERPYPCEACSKRFTRLEHLRSHFETIHQARKLVCRKCKRHVTELSGQVVCEGTRRYRLCNECIQESGCDNLVIDNSATANNEPGLLLGVDGVEEEEDKEKDWIMTDEDDLAVDSGTDLIIQEVDDSEEEQELQN